MHDAGKIAPASGGDVDYQSPESGLGTLGPVAIEALDRFGLAHRRNLGV